MWKLLALTALLVSPTAWSQTPTPAPVSAPAASEGAAAGDTEAILGRIQKKYAPVEVVQAAFAQTSTSPLYGAAEQSGTLTVQRPKKMRWDFTGDGKQFISNGKMMWVYSKADKQVIRYTDFGSQSASADAILQSLDKLGELFEVTVLDGEGVRLGLVPKDEASAAQVKRITLQLSDALDLQQVEVLDAYEGVTTLRFESVKLGGTVPASTFEFQVPDGVEVVDVEG